MSENIQQTIEKILNEQRTVAVVGMSEREDRPAHYVPKYLKGAGYNIIPVNPKIESVLGLKAYDTLGDIPEPVDTVLMIIRGERTPPFVDEAIAIGAKAVWMQIGIRNDEAAAVAHDAGLDVVMNHCMMVEHKHLHY